MDTDQQTSMQALEAHKGVTGSRIQEGVGADVARAVVQYTTTEYSRFNAEYGVKEGDIVVHFFLPLEDPAVLGKAGPRTKKAWNEYWLTQFPAVLSPVAKEYFQADRPRIVAQYTPEVVSWWFAARGFAASVLDPIAYCEGFLRRLDAALGVEPLPALDDN